MVNSGVIFQIDEPVKSYELAIFVKNTLLMETIIIQTDDDKAKALKQLLDAFKVDYKVEANAESPYNPEFVKKILERSKNAKEGDTIKMDPKDPWGSLGLK